MLKSFKYIILGVGIGLIIASFFVGTQKNSVEEYPKPEYVLTEQSDASTKQAYENADELTVSSETDETNELTEIVSEQPTNYDTVELDKTSQNTDNINVLTEDQSEKEKEEQLQMDEKDAEEIEIYISHGVNSFKVALMLYEKKLIDSPVQFEEYLIKKGVDTRINPGKYKLKQDMSIDEIVDLITGEVKQDS